jgi:hypothetical protein
VRLDAKHIDLSWFDSEEGRIRPAHEPELPALGKQGPRGIDKQHPKRDQTNNYNGSIEGFHVLNLLLKLYHSCCHERTSINEEG